MSDLPEMDAQVLLEALNSQHPPVVLDVREAKEFEEFPLLDGAIHIPLAELPARLLELPADTWIAVVCRSGGRSAKATQLLIEHGFDAANVLGGMSAVSALQA